MSLYQSKEASQIPRGPFGGCKEDQKDARFLVLWLLSLQVVSRGVDGVDGESAGGARQGRRRRGRRGRGGGEGMVHEEADDDVPVTVNQDDADEEAEVDDCY